MTDQANEIAPETVDPIQVNDSEVQNVLGSEVIGSILPETSELDSEPKKNIENDSVNYSRWSKVKSDSARIIDISGPKACVTMNVPGTGVRPFYFNKVFPDKDSQVEIYSQYARDIVVSALNGQNGCLLCYGQTGSG